MKGLVLEGGGMRGIFTAGVLDFFLDKGIEFDNAIGVSAGSCHACSYKAGQRGRAYATSVDYLDDDRYVGLKSLIKTGDLFGAEMLYKIIPDELYPIDAEAFKENSMVFRAVITNCTTGRAEYPIVEDIKRDIIYIRASSSLPAVSRLVMIGGVPYLDGGIADAIPIRKSMEYGNTKNVVVLTRDIDYRKGPNRLMPYLRAKYRRFPELVKCMEHRHEVYNDTLEFIRDEEAAGRIFVIRPERPIGLRRIEKDRQKLKAAYDYGYEEAQKAYPAMMEYLKSGGA